MINPDHALVTLSQIIEHNENNELPSSNLGIFQLRLYLDFHTRYDKFLMVNAYRSKIWGPENIAYDLDSEQKDVRNMLLPNKEVPHISENILDKATGFLFLSISGFPEASLYAESCIRGVLDIDAQTYQQLHEYFRQYTQELNLTDGVQTISFDDKRFLSNRREFSTLKYNLFYSNLVAIGYPEVERYNPKFFEQFKSEAGQRVQTIFETFPI